MVPLVSSFMLSTKEGKKAWAEPVIDPDAPDGWRFQVHTGTMSKTDIEQRKKGTKTARGNFACILTGAAISEEWNRAEGKAKRLGVRLMALVVEGQRERTYMTSQQQHEGSALEEKPKWEPEGDLYSKALGFRVPAYGLTRWADLFTNRQLVALTNLSDLISEVRLRVLADATAAGLTERDAPLRDGGSGSIAYADAIATYLAFAVSKLADRGSSLCTWFTERDSTRPTFARQALSMSWDFAELNTLLRGTGSFAGAVQWTAEAIETLGFGGSTGSVTNIDAAKNSYPVRPVLISTDPPYYDNIGYADLSDFFYVWLRSSVASIWPDLFRRITTPKDEELVATPPRHGGKQQAELFFMAGMGRALSAICKAATDGDPLAIYYAFKQSELAEEGVTSAGWAAFLQAIVAAGLMVDGTWPVRTELGNRMRGLGSNALASSIVLVCRKRSPNASVITRADFIRALKREMPAAIDAIRKAGVGPVDMQQSVIGPGMGVFSRHARVLEDDDSAMAVKTALALINRVWEEIENELDSAFDAETQVALAWFSTYGFEPKASGELITLTTAKNTSDRALFDSGVFKDMKGKAALTPREELPAGWSPATDQFPDSLGMRSAYCARTQCARGRR